jgi:hypothetical protein
LGLLLDNCEKLNFINKMNKLSGLMRLFHQLLFSRLLFIRLALILSGPFLFLNSFALTSKWSLSGGVTNTQSAVDHKDGTAVKVTNFNFAPSLTWTETFTQTVAGSPRYYIDSIYTLGALLGYRSDRLDSENSGFNDIVITGALKKGRMGLRWSPSMIVVFPTSRESSFNQSLKSSIGAGFSVGQDFRNGISYSVGTQAIKNLHEFETSDDGSINSSWGFKQSVNAGYGISRWNFSLGLAYLSQISYQNQWRDAYSHNQEIQFQFLKGVSLSLAHELSTSRWKPNGYESNFKEFDDQESLVHLNLGFVF